MTTTTTPTDLHADLAVGILLQGAPGGSRPQSEADQLRQGWVTAPAKDTDIAHGRQGEDGRRFRAG